MSGHLAITSWLASLAAISAMLAASACGGGGGIAQTPPSGSPSTQPDSGSLAQTKELPDIKPPAKKEEPLENEPPAEEEQLLENKPPGETEPPAETKEPMGTEPPADEQEPLEKKPPGETEPPAETKGPPGTEPPADEEEPLEKKPPGETEPPAETKDPAGTEPPVEEEQPLENEPPETRPPVEIGGVQLNRLQLPVAHANAPIVFEQDSAIKVPGRVEMVQKLNECLAASDSSCTRKDNWLILGEDRRVPGGRTHWGRVSLAIQVGAGADPSSGFFPALIDASSDYESAYFVNEAIRAGTIPEGAWVNWSRGGSFSNRYITGRLGGFDTSLLIRSSVVAAVGVGNYGSAQPYAQLVGPDAIDRQHEYYEHVTAELNRAILNTAVIFVYGLNNQASDIHSRSSHCGTQIMRACIGVVYEFLYPPGSGQYYAGGTSYSTGMLSGTAWVMKSLWPDLTSKQIVAIMLATARPLRGGVNEITGVGALDFTQLFEPVGPLAAKGLGSDDLALERGFLHLPGLTSFENPEGVDKFARSFQLATSTVAIQPGFADFDLDRFTPAAPGSRLHLAVNKLAGGGEDAALAFGHTNKLVLSSRYIGLCRDGQNTDLCLTTTRREDFFGGQGSGSFRLDDTTYTSFAATHQMPIRDRLKLGFSAAVTEARTSGKHLVGDVEGRLLQAEFSLRNEKDARSRKSRTSLSIWGSKFDGSMEMLGRQSPLTDRSYGARLRWQLDF